MMLGTVSVLTHEQAVRLARAFAVGSVRARIAAAEAQRRQPTETIQEFTQTGLVRLLVPQRWGGHELSFDTLVDAVIEIARVDASAGWCCGFLMVHGWLLAHFPDQAQEEVWSHNPDTLLAVSIIPVGQTTPTEEGGYLLSGTWPFVSGIDHCAWAMLMGTVPVAGAPDELRYFLVPKSDYQVRDTWETRGLRASGSHSVVVSDACVPAHRTVALQDLQAHGQAPGSICNEGRLYQLSVPEAFPLPLVAAILGATQGAFEARQAQVRTTRATLTQERIADKSQVQIRLAALHQDIQAAELVLRHVLGLIRVGDPFAALMRHQFRLHYATIARKCLEVSEELYTSSGGGANYISHPIGRFWVDIHAMAAHARLHFESAAEGFGRALLGLPANPQDPYAS
ncbi:MAG TPA: acyl-CoA dehydrogenase family protein [Ktedonobacteraceae bacterium]